MRTLAVAAVLLLAGCTAGTPRPPNPSASADVCGETIRTDALPDWARGGFSGDGRGSRHVYGDQGGIIAILFGHPLVSPPEKDRNNKILWVAREPYEPGGSLKITAELDGTAVRAEAEVGGGPGPSIVDLPRPGCWRLTLTWPGHTDTMDLTYGVPSP